MDALYAPQLPYSMPTFTMQPPACINRCPPAHPHHRLQPACRLLHYALQNALARLPVTGLPTPLHVTQLPTACLYLLPVLVTRALPHAITLPAYLKHFSSYLLLLHSTISEPFLYRGTGGWATFDWLQL